jgi:hypothetical protein
VYLKISDHRSRIWSVACGREDLLQKDARYRYINCKICGLHFEDVMFLNFEKNRLKNDAVPVLFKDRTTAVVYRESKGNITYMH